MVETVLFYIHSAAVLIFGVLLSAAFSGITLSRKNLLALLGLCAFSGFFQLILLLQLSEQLVWYVYPLVTHLPTAVFLSLFFRKNIYTTVSALLSAYLLCQPAKWMGVFAFSLFGYNSAEYAARLVSLLLVGAFALKYAAPCLRGIFNKPPRSILIFAIVPAVYYLFDYTTVVYSEFQLFNAPIVTEILPLLLCIAFLIFCMVYYREYEQKADAKRKEQIVSLVAQQQADHMENVKIIEQELRMARHDIRHLLELLAASINAGDLSKATELLQSYAKYIDSTKLTTYCGVDTVNYVLSAFATRCATENIPLHCDIQMDALEKDEIFFCSILQNALDNAFNAQLTLAPEKRNIQLLLKTMGDKLLLSVKNPVDKIPLFSDGLPLSDKAGHDHGYGSQSIRYLTERMNGSCQFSVKDRLFILRVIL